MAPKIKNYSNMTPCIKFPIILYCDCKIPSTMRCNLREKLEVHIYVLKTFKVTDTAMLTLSNWSSCVAFMSLCSFDHFCQNVEQTIAQCITHDVACRISNLLLHISVRLEYQCVWNLSLQCIYWPAWIGRSCSLGIIHSLLNLSTLHRPSRKI